VETSKALRSTNALPWWTWILPILILQCGTQISLHFKYTQGVADHYLPTALSIIMINWWGPLRIIPALYLNATFSTGLWGIENFSQWPIYSVPETLFAFLSWFLFTKLARGQFWFPNIKSLILFIALGIFVPIVIEITFLESLLIYFGEHVSADFWMYFVRNALGEFTSSFGLALPVLFYITPYLQQKNLLLHSPEKKLSVAPYVKVNRVEVMMIYIVLLLFTFLIPFEKFWFVYGFFALYIAIRYGFGLAIVTNYFIFLITYALPAFVKEWRNLPAVDQGDVINIFLGMLLLYIFAAITGRVITDLKNVELKLQRKNDELEQTNGELDRFVYSVSHDLSAPLKSILGLVNVSRIDPADTQGSYLNKIESSVKKLEAFISEILDYSRNKRLGIQLEKIKLKELCSEILENLKFMEEFQKVNIDLSHLEYNVITADKARLKIVLNNLLSNAIKFQKKMKEENSFIKISSVAVDHSVVIEVADNGQGIRSELQPRIFEMFFRGTENEKGSGLGLYIAKEAVEKMNGDISVHSNFGKGTTFTLRLPQN
jgi:two-component system, sensor histidine kinase